MTASTSVTTNFPQAMHSFVTGPVAAQKGVTPVISTVLQNNLNNAQWLLTCPLAPNPSNTMEYFTGAPSSFIIGSLCLANGNPLTTTVTVQVPVSWSFTTEAQAGDASLAFQNVGAGTVYNLAYSGTTNYQDTNAKDISNGYNTESYVFGLVPAQKQYGIWAWSAEYADLSHVSLSLDQTLHLQLYEPGGSCQYNCKTTCGSSCNKNAQGCCSTTCQTYTYTCNPATYDYHVTVSNIALKNTNIPIPVVSPQQYSGNNYLMFGNNKYGPFSVQDLGFFCDVAMYYNVGPSFICGSPPGPWSLVDPAGVLVYNGRTYQGLNVYTSTAYPGQYWTVYHSGFFSYTAGNTGSVQIQQYANVGALPYLLYNISLPATYSSVNSQESFLNLSLDTYGAQNFLNPSGRLDEFPFYTDAGFFASHNVQGTTYELASLPASLGLAQPVSDPSAVFLSNSEIFMSSLTSLPQNLQKPLVSPGKVGSYYQLNLPTPTYLSVSPNDYVYAIAGGTYGILDFNTKSILYKMRFIPSGYYNMSNYAPSSVSTPDLSTWTSAWQGYWSNSIVQQGQNLYVVSVTAVSDCNAWLGIFGKHCASGLTINPFAVTSDYAGDVFLLGTSSITSGGFMLAEIPNNPSAQIQQIETQLSQPKDFVPGAELAVSPGGQFVYAASTNDGGVVNAYQAPIVTGNGFSYTNNVPLSYSNSTFNLDIAQYLRNGGPFGNSVVAQAFKSAPPTNDIAANHHPVAIFNDKGLLYVLDNWTFSLTFGTGSSAQSLTSSIFMLRAFSGTQEVPIDGSSNDYLVPVKGTQTDISQGTGGTPANGWAPYGWPISAIITIPGAIQSNGAQLVSSTISFCVAYCDQTPASPLLAGKPYLPIGPKITINNDGSAGVGFSTNNFGLSMDFNDTLYLLAHTGNLYAGGVTLNDYTELAIFKLAIQNYTKTSYGANSPYVAYIGPALNIAFPLPLQGNTVANSIVYLPDVRSGGATTAGQELSQLFAPAIGAPSSFYYVESEGSPEKFLSFQSLLAEALPFGSSGYEQQANTLATSGTFPSGAQAPTDFSNLNVNTLGSALPKLPATYINSIVTGNILVPYCTANPYQMTATAIPTSLPYPVYAPDGSACGTCSAAPPAASTKSYQYCTTANAPLQSNYLNETVEGGRTYLQWPDQSYYTANLSDSGAITLPMLNYNIFTNRIFGEAYVNITVNPTNYGYYQTTSAPMVVNAVQNYNYQVLNYMLNGQVAYSAQQAIPSNPPSNAIVGANCGSACPQNYYYSSSPSRYFSGSGALVYAGGTQINFVTTMSLYDELTQADFMTLDLRNNPQLFGYNRFVYTFVDPFNNIIYAPVDADFAYTTKISMTPTVTVNVLNPNMSTVNVIGTATYTTPAGTDSLSNANIYLYYDTNLNYYDTQNTPTSNPAGYYQDSLLCAFAPSSTSCQLANPLYTAVQSQPTGTQESGKATFAANYNSMGQCEPEPASLLAVGNVVPNCNIYGSYGLPASNPAPNGYRGGTYQYCLPYYQNGNGILTSQLGLLSVATTDASGNFNYQFSVCGSGQNKVIASYYGAPAPQPQTVVQTPVVSSGGAGEFSPVLSTLAQPQSTTEFTYNFAPSTASAFVTIGSFALGLGDINALAILLLAVAAVLLARRKS